MGADCPWPFYVIGETERLDRHLDLNNWSFINLFGGNRQMNFALDDPSAWAISLLSVYPEAL
jgi:hypothetical protein